MLTYHPAKVKKAGRKDSMILPGSDVPYANGDLKFFVYPEYKKY